MNAFFKEFFQDIRDDLDELFDDIWIFFIEVKEHGLDLKALVFLIYISLVETFKELRYKALLRLSLCAQRWKKRLFLFLKLFGLGVSSQFIYWVGLSAWDSYFGYGYGPHSLLKRKLWVWDIVLIAKFTLNNRLLCQSILFIWFWWPLRYKLFALFSHKPHLLFKFLRKSLYRNMIFIQFIVLAAIGAWLIIYFSYYDTHNLHYLTFGPTIYYAERVFIQCDSMNYTYSFSLVTMVFYGYAYL